jgi:transposase
MGHLDTDRAARQRQIQWDVCIDNTYGLTYNRGMAARNREDTTRYGSSESRMTYTEFVDLFPDNTACLDYLKDKFYADGSRCPKCKRETKFHRIKGRSAYSCQYCGHHVYPTAGTIFHKSTVSLHLWFYAIFLMSSTRCGMAAKQLEREIGVTYKTAHRMFKKIRHMLIDDNDGSPFLGGEVEADETYVGARRRGRRGRPAEGDDTKTPVFAMVERNGKVRARVVPNAQRTTLLPIVKDNVEPGSTVYTDEMRSYALLAREGFTHRTIAHSLDMYVVGDIHTNTVEGYFGLIKGGLNGVYRGAVRRHLLQSYLDEYSFRYNHRHTVNPRPMFWNFLDRVEADRIPF